MRIVVLGYLIRGPLGGLAWHHLQYLVGLQGLGHDVHFHEDSDDYPTCYDPDRDVTDIDPNYGLRFADFAFSRLGARDCWSYFDAHTASWHGRLGRRAERVIRAADIVLNLSGVNPLRDWTLSADARVLVDTDPCFSQIRHLTNSEDRARAAEHTSFFTFAENFGKRGCSVPNDGFPWRATRQPVVIDAWPTSTGNAGGRYTTVMQWDS